MTTSSSNLSNIPASIRGIVFDVDGILTDGRIIYTDDGHELKQFHVQDGASLKLLMQHDIQIGIITGRRSPIVARRARELGIQFLKQGASSKADALNELINDGFIGQDLAAVGDDIQDLAMFQHPAVTFSITVPNAHPTVLAQADAVTERRGGDGVVVEISQALLRAQSRWPY